jgi:hypothetical protein
VSGQQLKEAQAINRSLSALGDVIAALQARGGHVPYRNSKLTQVGGTAQRDGPWGVGGGPKDARPLLVDCKSCKCDELVC